MERKKTEVLDMAYDEKQKQYTIEYLKGLKEIRFRVKPEEYAAMEKFAKEAGYKSMRQFYLDAINSMMANKKEG